VLIESQVIVVGAGPVGAAVALVLGEAGVDVLLVDDGARDASPQPGAKLANVRSMSLMRRWGVADELRKRTPLPSSHPSDVHFVTRMAGHRLVTFENGMNTLPDPRFPEPSLQCPQLLIAEVLRRRATATGRVRLLTPARFESLVQDDDGVTAVLQDLRTGEAATAQATWLVGADGGRSRVRRELGVGMSGVGDLGTSLSIVFRSTDLVELNPHGPGMQYWAINRDAPGVLAPLDTTGGWVLTVSKVWRGSDPTPEEIRSFLHGVAGAPIAYDVLGWEPWTARCLLADASRVGRAFLIGDAAHLHPPAGGFGMNMGFGDAADLGWKLAAVLAGWGGDVLLDSHEAERRRVHDVMVRHAMEMWRTLPSDLVEADLDGDASARDTLSAFIETQKRQEYETFGLLMGLGYDGSPVILGDGSPEAEQQVREYVPSARPGQLAPHVELADGSALYDRLGAGLTLLDLSGAGDAGLRAAARRAGIPLEHVVIDDARARELYEADLALVRPDLVVAWRGPATASRPDVILDAVCGRGARAARQPLPESRPTPAGA
jgi:2-polyprenyl-6-methoxyphenol hydroxylase-like FAD-dependent oxidoreductase